MMLCELSPRAKVQMAYFLFVQIIITIMTVPCVLWVFAPTGFKWVAVGWATFMLWMVWYKVLPPAIYCYVQGKHELNKE